MKISKMERLDFSDETKYSSIEASIHLNRYLSAKRFVKDKKVLDVACGEGYGSYLIKRWGAAEVVGVDISKEALAVAEKKFSCKGVTFINHTAEELPFDDGTFDVVVSYETIEHLDYPEKFLKEIKRVAKSNATIIVTCPNDPYYYSSQEDYSNPYHKRKYTFFDFNEISKKYLGENVVWYLGFAINGFMTMPFENSKYPDKDSLPNTNSEMFNFEKKEYAFTVSPDRYINHWNANYFLGIWGTSNNEKIDTVVSFPREFFIEPDNPIFADIKQWDKMYSIEKKLWELQISEEKRLKLDCEKQCAELSEKIKQYEYKLENQRTEHDEEINRLKRQYEDTLERQKSEYAEKLDEINKLYTEANKENEENKVKLAEEKERNIDLSEEMRVTRISEQRISSLLEVANKEKGFLWDRINQYEEKLQLQNENRENAILEKEAKISDLENHNSQLNNYVNEYERYKRSISYKLMQPVRKAYDILRFWKKQ